jgi:hypothetical protein
MEQERQARAPVVEKKANGKFAAFIDEAEEEERNERDEEEMRLKAEEAAAALVAKREAEFPTFGLKPAPKTAAPSNNWATMAQNAVALPLPKPKPKAVVAEKPKANYIGWADDSEDEYEEEIYESVVDNNDHINITYYINRSTADDDDW